MIPYNPETFSIDEVKKRASDYYHKLDKRRTVRDFAEKDIPEDILKDIIMTASSAPSGAHKQPWTFCAVKSSELKTKIRKAAETEEYENYNNRMSEEWLDDLEPLGTDWEKPFLEKAPWLIIVMKKPYDLVNNSRKKNYYVNESVGIAVGFLLTAIHNAGLVALTHTPSPMNFLEEILDRPKNERAFMLIPVGYPAEDTRVPDLKRKGSDDVIEWYL